MNTINYNEFMKNLTIKHCNTAKNFQNALEYYVQEKINMVTYNTTNKFLLFSAGFLQADENGNYFYEFIPIRDCDIIDNIKIDPIDKNIKITYHIGRQQYNPQDIKEFIVVASPYNDFRIRLTFLEKPTENFEFFVHLRNYIMDSELRTKLRMSKLITDSNIYEYGVCQKI